MYLKKDIQIPCTNVMINFVGWEVIEADLDRFIEMFLNVWSQIPVADQTIFSSYWSQKSPRIELQGSWMGDESATATTERTGEEIKFNWPTCSNWPNAIVEVVIAHEMGHVFHYAIGKHRFNMTIADLPRSADLPIDTTLLSRLRLRDEALVEMFADQKATGWGLNPLQKDTYLRVNFDWKGGVFIKRKKPRNEKRAASQAARNRWLSLIAVPQSE